MSIIFLFGDNKWYQLNFEIGIKIILGKEIQYNMHRYSFIFALLQNIVEPVVANHAFLFKSMWYSGLTTSYI